MTHATGIELGPATCVLVSANPGANGAEVGAAQAIERSMDSATLAAALRTARQVGHLPRRARVVAWGLTAPSRPDDPARLPTVKPFEEAGFQVEALLTPAEALARLAASRQRSNGGPVAWLSLNVHGAAIAIVEGATILFSKTLTWKYDHQARTVREQLLRRYTLVSHIGPELKRGIELVRANHGRRVDTVVTCGDLPELRSLTMPLIEELDVEVETLDSPEGLRASKPLTNDQLAEMAPAIRLATAAAVMPVEHNRSATVFPALAAMALLAAGVWLAASALRLNSNRRPSQSPIVQNEPARPAAAPTVPGPLSSGPAARTVPGPTSDTPLPAASTGEGKASGAVGGLGPSDGGRTAEQPKAVGRLPPVPPVTSILVDGGRKLALIGGQIVTVGDRIGPRTVVRIGQRSVVLREPSGAEITVLLSPGHSDGVKLTPLPGTAAPPARART